MKKLLSLGISFSLLFSSVLPVQAHSYWRGTMPDADQREQTVNDAVAQLMQEMLHPKTDLFRATEHIRKIKRLDQKEAEKVRRQQQQQRGTVLFALEETPQRYIPVLRGMPFLFENDAQELGSYYGLSLSKQAWAWAAIHEDLKGLKNRVDWQAVSYWNRDLEMEEAAFQAGGASLDIARAIKDYGIAPADKQAAVKHLSAMLRQKGLCSQTADQETVQCLQSTQVMEALAVLSLQFHDDQILDEIYHFVQNKHRGPFGPALVLYFSALMMGMNTDASYRTLQRFLRQEATQTGGGKIVSLLEYLTLHGIFEAGQQISGEQRYLNSYTARFAYLDNKAVRRYMPNLNVQVILKQVTLQPGDPYQIPLGNVYEDIGAMLVQDAQNPRTARLCKDILNTEAYNKPLTLGVLTGDGGNFTYRHGGKKAVSALEGLLRADFLDLNEGSQRRLKEDAAQAMYAHGLMDLQEREKYSLPDEAKKARYNRMDKIKSALSMVDTAVMVVFLPSLVRAAAVGAARTVKALRGFSVRMTRLSAVKAAAAPKPSLSPSAVEAKVPAPKPAPSPAKATAPAPSKPAPVKATPAVPAKPVPAPSAAPAVKATPAPARSKPVPAAQASVLPAGPTPRVSPAWQTIRTQVWDNMAETGYNLQRIFGDLWHTLKLKTGAMVTASALNVTAAPAATEFAASGAAHIARTEQAFSSARGLGRTPKMLGLDGTKNFWQFRTQLTQGLTVPPPFGAPQIMTRGAGKLSAWNTLRESLSKPISSYDILQSVKPAPVRTYSALSSETAVPYWRAAAAAAAMGTVLTDFFTGGMLADGLTGILAAGSPWLFPEIRDAVKKEKVDPLAYFHHYDKKYAPAEAASTEYEKQLTQYQAENFRQKYRLRENLVTEAVAWGLQEDMAETYSKEKLLDYIITMQVSTKKAEERKAFLEEQEKKAPMSWEELRDAVRIEISRAESLSLEAPRGMYSKTFDVYEEVMADKNFIYENYVYEDYQGTFNKKLNRKISVLLVNDAPSLIEDDISVLRADTKHIQRADAAYSGNDVIKMLKANPDKYDIIFTDYYMSDGCGYEIAKYVYENNLKVKVIMFARAGITAQWLYHEHFHGKLNGDAADMIIYASNILTEGRANNQAGF